MTTSYGIFGIRFKFMILIKLTNLPTFIGLDDFVIHFLYKVSEGVLYITKIIKLYILIL